MRNAAAARAEAAKVLTMPRPRKPSAGDLLLGRHWAMLPDRVQALRAVAETALANPNALTAWADASVPETFLASTRDGIATIRVNGPMCRVWDFWAWIFGSTPYEVIAADLVRLRNDASVRAIILSIDSPGGEVAGCGELASLIHGVRDVKPVVAHLAGFGCSAAYWMASAARSVYADPAAVVGSIGTCATFVDYSGLYEELGIEVIEMVSTQSPRKNADPTTADGRAEWVSVLDSLAAVFIGDVARYRGVDEATVLSDYGQGGVFVGQAAVNAGLVDALATHDAIRTALLDELDRAASPTPITATEILMAKTTTAPRASAPKPGSSARSTDPTLFAETDPKAAPDDDVAPDEVEEEDETDEVEEEDASTTASVGEQLTAFAAQHPEAAAALRAEGALAERMRLTGIDALAGKVKGERAQRILQAGRQDPAATAETVALQLIQAGVAIGASVLSGRVADEAEVDHPSNADTGLDAVSEVDREVRAILAAGKRPARG